MNEVDNYIDNFDEPVRKKLRQLRSLIIENLPEAREVISYGMPAYKINKTLVYFAAHKNHIGF